MEAVSTSAPWLTADVLIEGGDWAEAGDVEVITERVVAALSRHRARPDANDLSAAVMFDTDQAVRALNKQYRGQDKATNVLSFPAPPLPQDVADAADVPQHLGDIILAAETVHREARDLGIARADHTTHLVLHGLLHLLGYDHETDAAAHEMEAIETAVLADLGIADPYADSDPA